MKYMGSKSRIKKHLIPILQNLIEENQIKTYIEPFVGGANLIDGITCDERIGVDLHDKLIALLKHVQHGGELPTEVPKPLYDDVRSNQQTDKYDDWYVGAIGFLASYNGRYFDGGYAKTLVSKTGKVRNYYDEAKRNIEQQASLLKDIQFHHGDYTSVSEVKGTLIYCDPPYQGTKQFSVSKNFDYDRFWQWVREMSEHNIVLVSEHHAPDDFECIWEAPITRTQDNRKREVAIERLFRLKNRH